MIVHPEPKISRDADCETRDNLNHYYVHTVHCTLARILHFGTYTCCSYYSITSRSTGQVKYYAYVALTTVTSTVHI